MLGNSVRGKRRARQFDHRAHFVFDLQAVLAHYLPRDFIDQILLLSQLFADRNQRHHDFQSYLFTFALHLNRGLENRAALHAGNFGK